MIRHLSLVAALGVAAAPFALADEAAPLVKAEGRIVAFGDSGARFHVDHDTTAGAMTFRLAEDANVRIAQAPVVTLNTDAGPRDVTLVSVAGQPNTWRLSHESLRTASVDGTMKIVVDGKTFDAPLAVAGRVEADLPEGEVTTKVVARHGGRVLAFPDCGGHVEVLHDAATGTLTVYSLMGEDVEIVEAPSIVVTETAGPRTITLTKVNGETVAWRVSNPVFRTAKVDAKLRILVDGKACEVPLAGGAAVAGATRGGQIVTVTGGPRFEVVSDERANAWTFYAIDPVVDGRPYTIEQPPVFVYETPAGPRTVTLTRVEGEPRAWRLAGVDAGVSRPLDGRLRLSLFGKSLETRVGLSGVGVDVR
jgi:hypothetical protein